MATNPTPNPNPTPTPEVPASSTAQPAPTPLPMSAPTPQAKPRYLIVALPAHADEANAVLAKAIDSGYPNMEYVYTVTTPSSASTAFVILSQ